jgi:hypothetical protein
MREHENAAETASSARQEPVRARRLSGLEASVAHLQRTAGNEAVTSWIMSGRGEQPALSARTGAVPFLQRDLLGDFGKDFKDAAADIAKGEQATKLVEEAEKAGAKYGGYSEKGPWKNAYPYTVGDTVYIPKSSAEPVRAASDFLFELNNAIHKPQFAAVSAKASKGSITAKEYAREKTAIEVDGMLRAGLVWADLKKGLGGGADLNKFDQDWFLDEYNQVKSGKKTKDDIVNDVLARKYTEGVQAGKTVEEFYMEQYKALAPAPAGAKK